MRSLSQPILLCLLATASLSTAANLPTTVQFDIIFPVNNTVYKPVYPFPVVLAVHNGSAATSSAYHWDWSLVNYEDYDVITYGSSNIESSPPREDTLVIAPVFDLINSTAKNLFLRITFGIFETCDAKGVMPSNKSLDVAFHKPLYFSLDRENGQIPDATAGGPCATPIGAIGIEKEVPVDQRWAQDDGSSCLVLKSGAQPAQECAFRVDEAVAKQVADRMSQFYSDANIYFVSCKAFTDISRKWNCYTDPNPARYGQ
ncbi:uncharacterized protein EI97DRAFT_467650 [Westerdykella ornata]|uniref:DUF7136 domain-containing protein n=1 Tax=Westerdykella ornata TaxID=318751 RepID=A0A6A6JM01_WESOR|nr:uncharacterized protein EI97DRAFT_467650 [Westerdykella ornata]KAF2275939.1 hypothetical protein EI97DRAFT_467650 [Westerdykella ornata]